MKIYFIRHARSENNEIEKNNPNEYFYLRIADPSLTNIGVLQAQKLKSRLGSVEIDQSKF